jgi:hypothetical protein
MNIQEFRKKYPDYNDMSDAELSDRLYKKSYSDMDRKDFESKFLGTTQKSTPQSVLKEDLQKNPMSGTEKFLTGVGHGMYKTYQGARQAGAELGLGGDAKAITQEGQEEASMYKPLEESSTAAKAGEVVGETAPYMAIPGGAGKSFLGRTAVATGIGATQGALQFKDDKESRITNAAIGGALGAGGQALVSGVGKGLNALRGSDAGQYVKSEVQKLGEKFKIPTTLGEDIDSARAKVIETLAEKVPFLGISNFRVKQLAAAESAAKDSLNNFVANPEKPDFWGNKEFIDATYKKVQDTASTIKVKTSATDTAKAAEEFLTNYPDIFKSVQDKRTKDILTDIQKSSTDKTFTFDDLWRLRKGLGVAKETARGSGNIEAVGVLGDVKRAVDKDIDYISKQSGTKISEELKNANDVYQRYNVKYELVQEAFDKAVGKKGAHEMFSPKSFSTSLKNMVYKANIQQKSKLFTPDEVENLTGLATIMQAVKRSGMYAENVATGNRNIDLLMTGGLGLDVGYAIHNPAGAALAAGSVAGFTSIIKFLTTTTAGKNLVKVGSKVESLDSPVLQKVIDKIYQAVPRAAASPDASMVQSAHAEEGEQEQPQQQPKVPLGQPGDPRAVPLVVLRKQLQDAYLKDNQKEIDRLEKQLEQVRKTGQ